MAALILTLLLTLTVHAQTSPKLLTIFPPGGKAGSAVEVAVGGQDLGEVQELRFSHDGITAASAGTNKFTVEIGRKVPPGIYEVRALGRRGLSNPRAFAVGTLPETALDKPPTARDSAKEISFNSTVNIRAEANAAQFFQFTAKPGDRVLVRCVAPEIDSRFEPVLAVFDADGRELDHNRQVGLLDFIASESSRYFLEVHDTIFRGGPEFWYRLSVGTFAQVDFVFPPALAPGKNRVSLFGRNMPGGKTRTDVTVEGHLLEQLDVEVDVPADTAWQSPANGLIPPAQPGAKLFVWTPSANLGLAPIVFSLALSPPVPETEPNNTPATAQKISPPCDIAGHFGARTDRDWFTFEAKKGDVLWIELTSQRLGLPTDPLVVVQRVNGESATEVLELNDSEANIGGAEFNTTHRDPSGRFEAKEAGTYRLMVRDLFAPARPDPRRVYHLALRKPTPDFSLVSLPQPPPSGKKDAKDITMASLSLRRGETVAAKVLALRRDGFTGEIEIDGVALPAGVLTAPARIESGKNSTFVFLTATDDVATTNAALTLIGSATVNSQKVKHAIAPASLIWGTADPAVDAAESRLIAQSVFSVTPERLPLRVHATSNVIETTANKSVKINFLIDRQTNFTGGVKLKPFGLAALDSVPEADLDAKATNLVLQIDLKEKKVGPGTHVFTLLATATGKTTDVSKKPKDTAIVFYSEPVVLRVKPAPPPATNSPAK